MEEMSSKNIPTAFNLPGLNEEVTALLEELFNISRRACEECIQHLPEALQRCDIDVVCLWVDLGIEISSASAATGIRYFKTSLLAITGVTDKRYQLHILESAIQILGTDDDTESTGGHLALECVLSGPKVACVLAKDDLDVWVSLGMELGKWNPLAAAEYFKESAEVLQALPFTHIRQWVECGVKLVTKNQLGNFDYLLTIEFFRTTANIFEQITEDAIRLRVLECTSQIADRSPHAAMAFMKQSPNSVAAIFGTLEGLSVKEITNLHEERLARFEQWIEAGLQALEYSEEAARAYFSYESRWALVSIERAMSGVSLRTMHRPLRLLVKGLSGHDVRIETHHPTDSATSQTAIPGCPVDQPMIERPSCLQDTTSAIVLPSMLNAYPRKSDNARLYRIMAAHKAGHFEFGTHQLEVSSIEEFICDLQVRYGKSHHPASVWEVFTLYPSPSLAQDLWMIVEDSRIDSRLSYEYPGLRRDMDYIVKEVVSRRPLFQGGTLTDMMLEALIRMSVGESTEGMPDSCLTIVNQAASLFSKIRVPQATCKTSLEVADQLYELLDVFHSTDPVLSETGNTSDESKNEEFDEESLAQRGDSPSYQRVENLIYRRAESFPSTTNEKLIEQQSFEMEPGTDDSESAGRTTFFYDEWDAGLGDYRSDWCRVTEAIGDSTSADQGFVDQTLVDHQWTIHRLRKYFEGIRPSSLRWVKGQLDGEDVDVDAVIDRCAERCVGQAPSDRVFMNREVRVRDVSAAILVDISGSTNRVLDDTGKRVIDVEKEALVLLCEALETLGDRYGIYGFSGRSRRDVRFDVFKDFDHGYNSQSKQRIGGIQPIQQNRDGAAIRHAVSKLRREQAKVKLLMLLSDGRPLDDQYEHDYAFEDTRMALREAKRMGVHPFCVTIDRTAPEYLSRMCGEFGFIVVDRVQRLPDRLPEIYGRLTT